MMKYSLKLIIGTILAIAIIACSTAVFAESAVIIGGGSASAQNETVNNTVNNTINNTTYNTVNTTQTYNTSATNTLPQTGVTDGYVVAILVTVCAISAIYAYRKIRDYNV